MDRKEADIQKQEEALAVITKEMGVTRADISDIQVLKKGMTNRSFLFTCQDKRYIIRVPGEGTEQLINREQEYQVYQTLAGKNICDSIIYINPINGFKITKFYENARVCDPTNPKDLQQCMQKLRKFHEMELSVPHTFDLFRQIEFYESLWDGASSIYNDYEETKAHVMELQAYIEQHIEKKVLTHIDAVPDNFLMYENAEGGQSIRLIDWEYAGMQDPHVDIAMFCIYSMYNREQIDQLIDFYFVEGCPVEIRIKIYCYIAVCGLLWSNWCEYKRMFGVEFGDYALAQYEFAREYYRISKEEMERRR